MCLVVLLCARCVVLDCAMDVVEVDGELAIRTCKMYNYKYTVITAEDIVIPPKVNDNISSVLVIHGSAFVF